MSKRKHSKEFKLRLLKEHAENGAKRTKRVGASSRVRGREMSYEARSILLHHPMSGLNFLSFSAARAVCISPQYFHPLALPLKFFCRKRLW